MDNRALPNRVTHWSLRTLREKLIKAGAKAVRYSRHIIFHMAEAPVPRALLCEILDQSEPDGKICKKETAIRCNSSKIVIL